MTFLAGRGGGAFELQTEATVGGLGTIQDLASYDLDEDGDWDVAVSGGSSVTVLWQDDELRTMLRNGQWRRVLEELTELAEGDPENEKIHTEIAYLTKHGEGGRLKYPTFRARGLRLGSGAIASSIRRVIHLRLKGKGIFWCEENAEEMLRVRAQVITDRWDERMKAKRRHLRYDGRSDWRWEPQPMSSKA